MSDKLEKAKRRILDVCKEHGVVIEDGFDGGFVIVIRDTDTGRSTEIDTHANKVISD